MVYIFLNILPSVFIDRQLIFTTSIMAGALIFFKFFITGGLGFGIDYGISRILLQVVGFRLLVANSIGFLSGEIIKFLLNRTWTFHSTDPEIMMQFIKFISISLTGLVLVNAMVYYMVEKRKQPFLKSKVIAMFLFMFWNFSANAYFTFRF